MTSELQPELKVDPDVTGLITRKMARLWNYRLGLRFLGVLYALTAVLFFVFPAELLAVLNAPPAVLHFGLPLPASPERFWQILATSQMATLSALCFLAAESPYVRGYALVHLLAKVVSGALLLYLFFVEQPFFVYLLGGVLDWVILLGAGLGLVRIGRNPDGPTPPAATGDSK